jgi:hypothetical protein
MGSIDGGRIVRTYRTYQHTYRPGRRGVLKTKPMQLESNCAEERLHRLLLGVCVLVMVIVVVML